MARTTTRHSTAAADPAQLSFADALTFPALEAAGGRGAAQVREALSLRAGSRPRFRGEARSSGSRLPAAANQNPQSPRHPKPARKSSLRAATASMVIAVLLDTKNGVIGLHVVSVGDLSSTVAHPREVFKAAILANAAHIWFWRTIIRAATPCPAPKT